MFSGVFNNSDVGIVIISTIVPYGGDEEQENPQTEETKDKQDINKRKLKN